MEGPERKLYLNKVIPNFILTKTYFIHKIDIFYNKKVTRTFNFIRYPADVVTHCRCYPVWGTGTGPTLHVPVHYMYLDLVDVVFTAEVIGELERAGECTLTAVLRAGVGVGRQLVGRPRFIPSHLALASGTHEVCAGLIKNVSSYLTFSRWRRGQKFSL